MREREIVREPVAEREIVIDDVAPEREYVVDDRPRGGSGAVAAIIGILLVLLLGWFLVNTFGGLDDGDATINVEAPEGDTDGGVSD
jgi:hypothetical protein